MKPKSKDPGLVPHGIGVKNVKTTDLFPNPHNPRLLFDREPMQVLNDSIKKVGILVPLTVYLDSKKHQFVILDGQRRWTCARNLNLPEVPVNEVSEPTLVQNIVTMFQIHKLREDWELMPTALKLELLMTELGERGDKKISELTGLDIAVVTRCKKLLSYPTKYKDQMLDPDPSKRIKADFFIELYPIKTDKVVKTMEWFRADIFTEQMLERHKNKRLRSVTDFRKVKQSINNAAKANQVQQISKRLKAFAENEELPLESLEIEIASKAAEAKSMGKILEKTIAEVTLMDVESMIGEEELWKSLEELMKLIRSKLLKAGRRLPRI